MKVLLVLAALVPLVLSSSKSDIYTAFDDYYTNDVRVFYYHNDYEHFISGGQTGGVDNNADKDPFTVPYSYRAEDTGDYLYRDTDYSFSDSYSGTTVSYEFYDDLPLTPGTGLGFHVYNNGNNVVPKFAYWVRTEWFQSLYSRTCWYDNDDDCLDMSEVIVCKNYDAWTLADEEWLKPTFQPTKANGWYYPYEEVTCFYCLNEVEWYWHLPRNSFMIYGDTNNVDLRCRMIIPEPSFADTTMEKGGCQGSVVDTTSLVHPVTETLHMDDFLTIYPPIHFSYYGELIRAMTIFPMGNVQFNDVMWNQWFDLSDVDAGAWTLGQLTYMPDQTYDVDSGWYGWWEYLNTNVNDTFAHAGYMVDPPAWVEWPTWYGASYNLNYPIFDDTYIQRSCQVSMWANWLDYRFDDLATYEATTVTITYGVLLTSPKVFVIRMEDVPYAGTCTPAGKGVTLQLQIYEDTFNTSRMEIHYLNTDRPVERFVLPLAGETGLSGVSGFDADTWDYWYQDSNRFDAQMPVIGMTSCDMVWGGKLQGYFPQDNDCVSIVGCRNSYHVGADCVCAERFRHVPNPTTDHGIVEPRCQACPAFTFKADMGDDTECSVCPHNSIMADNIYGMDDNSECECIALYGGNAAMLADYKNNYMYIDSLNFDAEHIPCEPCAGSKSLKKFVGNRPCTCAKDNSASASDIPRPVERYNSGEMAYASDDGYGLCECQCGTYGHAYRQWSSTAGTNYYASCTPCPNGWFNPLPGNNYPGQQSSVAYPGCHDCSVQTTYGPTDNTRQPNQCECGCITSALWNHTNYICECIEGYAATSPTASTRSCAVCAVDYYKDWVANDACTHCPGVSKIPETPVGNHDALVDCECPIGYGRWADPVTGTPNCFKCTGDLWDNTTRDSQEALSSALVYCGCEAHSTAYLDTTGATPVIRCGCIKEYEYSSKNWGNCNLCKNNWYKNWVTTSTSSADYSCKQCSGVAMTFGGLEKASSDPTPHTGYENCFCPLGYQLTYPSSCKVCDANYVMTSQCLTVIPGNGTYAEIHENTACSRCPQSTLWYANPRASIFGYVPDWSMTTLPGNTPDLHDEESDCYCTAGFYRHDNSGTTCGNKYTCYECGANTYRDITASTTHTMDNTPESCYTCSAGPYSARRQNFSTSCYCDTQQYWDGSACQNCPTNYYQQHFGREPACKICDGRLYNDAGSCMTWSYNQATHPVWASTDYNGRAMYLYNKQKKMADSKTVYSKVLNWPANQWLQVTGDKLVFDTDTSYGFYYYDFYLDFEFLTGFTHLEHSLRLYLGGYDGINIQPGMDHGPATAEWFEIYPYYCWDDQTYTPQIQSLSEYWGYYSWTHESIVDNVWYVWDPTDVFLSVAMPITIAGQRVYAIKLSGYHRYHDVYTDDGSGRMDIYFLIYEDTSVHAIDMFVQNAPHLCEDDARSNSFADFVCDTEFDYNGATGSYSTAQDYYYYKDQPYYAVYDEAIVRFDMAWCQRCECSATNAYYEIFPEDWDKNGCMCGCQTFNNKTTPTQCQDCASRAIVDHYGVCTPITTDKRIIVDSTNLCATKCADTSMNAACGCDCGEQYNTTANVCYTCPVNYYGDGILCRKCPFTSPSTPAGSCVCNCDTSLNYYATTVNGVCVCDAGYFWSNGACTKCADGYYKAVHSNDHSDAAMCLPCPFDSYRAGSDDPTYCNDCPGTNYMKITKQIASTVVGQCYCNYGETWDGSNCNCCDWSYFKPNISDSGTCYKCKDNANFDWYCAGRNECGCDQDYGTPTSANLITSSCTQCSWFKKQYKMYRGNGPCAVCPTGYNLTEANPLYPPTFDFDATYTPSMYTPLTTTAYTFDDISSSFSEGYYGMKTVRLFPYAYTTPEGTFKGQASFRDVNVYIRGQHTILLAIEEDGYDITDGYTNYDSYYDVGIQFGYRIDIETLRIRQDYTTGTSATARVEVSFDFEGVHDGPTNKSNIIQLQLAQSADAVANEVNQQIFLTVGSVSDITVPALVYFKDYFTSGEPVTVLPDGYDVTNCLNQFDKSVPISAANGYNYWPLCKMPNSRYIDTYLTHGNSWRYVINFDFDPCKPNPTPPATPCTIPTNGIRDPTDGKCYVCPTCTTPNAAQNWCDIDTAGTSGSNGWDTSFIWTHLYNVPEAQTCVCASTYGYDANKPGAIGTHGGCTACSSQVKNPLGQNRAVCTACPPGSFFDPDLGGSFTGSYSDCICNLNYTHITHYYDYTATGSNDDNDYDHWCRKCPSNARARNEYPASTLGARKNENQCICDEWFASIEGQWAIDGVTDSQTQIADAGWTCACIPGYYGTATSPKVYADLNGANTQCLPCPKNTYTATTNANGPQSGRCVPCANGLTAYNATGFKDLCYCPEGSGGLPNQDIACVTCVGGSKLFDGNAVCKCDVDVAVASPGICMCPAGYAGDARGIVVNVTKECHLCPVDTYKSAPSNGDCTPCPYGSGTFNGTIGAISVQQCECKADYQGLGGNGTNCTYCHLGIKPPGDGIACTCFTSAGVVQGTDGLCWCAPGYYFSYLDETCQLCGADSYSTDDNLDTECAACPQFETTSGSASPFTSPNDCVCMAGYEPISGVCTPCAVGYHKYTPGDQPCDPGAASSTISSHGGGSTSGNSGAAVMPSFVVLALGLLLFLFKL